MKYCPCCGEYTPTPRLLCEECQRFKDNPEILLLRPKPIIIGGSYPDVWDKYEAEMFRRYGRHY